MLKQLGEELHQQLLNGDLTAPARIFETFLPLLVSRLKSKYRYLDDPHLAESAADDALLDYVGNPGQFLPQIKRLDTFLLLVAERDLLNMLRSEKNSGLPPKMPVVELEAADGEYRVENGDLSVEEQVLLLTSPIWDKLEGLLPNTTDQKIVRLLMENERSTDVFAAVLGISDQSPEEQFAEVKRHKDRIKKTLQRHLGRPDLIDE